MKSALMAAALVLVAGCGNKQAQPAAGQVETTAVATTVATETPVTNDPNGPPSIQVPMLALISAADPDVAKGKELFQAKGCAGCHKIGGGKLVGPDLKGVTARRQTAWIEKMILHPEVMLKEDGTAKDLFKTHLTAMPNQNVDPNTELPALLAWLKANEK